METFMEVYRRQLAKAVAEHPEEYGWPVSESPEVADRMAWAIKGGHFNKDSRAIKATCKELGIKHTYKDIKHFIANHA